MNSVYSRWPSPVTATNRVAQAPRWMSGVSRNRRRDIWPATIEPLLVVLAASAAGTATILWHDCSAPMAAALAAGACLVIVACAYQAMSLARRRTLAERRYNACFHRAGVSMWREDWSAIMPDVAKLVRDGVDDIEAHYATRPEALRALRRKVVIEDVNPCALEETGAQGKHVYLGPLDRLLPDTDQTFVQWIVSFARGDRFYRSETHIIKADGAASDTLFTARLPQHVDDFSEIIVTSLDITEYKAAQARLQAAEHDLARAARITTMGALTASIAHEVNSPLAAILANAQAALRLLQREVPDVGEARMALDELIIGATRARDVVRRTREFMANTPVRLENLNVLEIARDASLIVEREVRALGGTIHIQAAADLPVVRADPVQLQQVFVNLLVNGAQAAASHAGPRDLLVSLSRWGATLEARVTDTGPGVEEGRRQAIFEPFHTTRPDGMGMGLTICRDCIQALGGKIWVEGETGEGASFRFTIPCEE